MNFPNEPEPDRPGIRPAYPPLVPGPRPAADLPLAGPAGAETAARWPAEPAGLGPGGEIPGGEIPGGASRHGARRSRRRGRVVAVVMLVVVGLAGMGAAGVELVKEMSRNPTNAEVAAALAGEIATRWQRLPAGQVFPAQINYLNAQTDTSTARLVGIAAATSCKAALEPSAYRQIRSLGCTTMLRATYTDASSTLVATVAIGVMASPGDATAAQQDLSPMAPASGPYALPVPGTIADEFGNADRGASGIEKAGPYIFAYTAGYTDGLPGRTAKENPELLALGTGIAGDLAIVLTSHPSPCAMKDIHC